MHKFSNDKVISIWLLNGINLLDNDLRLFDINWLTFHILCSRYRTASTILKLWLHNMKLYDRYLTTVSIIFFLIFISKRKNWSVLALFNILMNWSSLSNAQPFAYEYRYELLSLSKISFPLDIEYNFVVDYSLWKCLKITNLNNYVWAF